MRAAKQVYLQPGTSVLQYFLLCLANQCYFKAVFCASVIMPTVDRWSAAHPTHSARVLTLGLGQGKTVKGPSHRWRSLPIWAVSRGPESAAARDCPHCPGVNTETRCRPCQCRAPPSTRSALRRQLHHCNLRCPHPLRMVRRRLAGGAVVV